MLGTMSYEDIYGAGSLETLSSNQVGETTAKTNPNTTQNGGDTIFHLKGNFLGQPILTWIGLVVLLVAVKFIAEKEK